MKSLLMQKYFSCWAVLILHPDGNIAQIPASCPTLFQSPSNTRGTEINSIQPAHCQSAIKFQWDDALLEFDVHGSENPFSHHCLWVSEHFSYPEGCKTGT